ncbi:ATP-binding protein [Streptomyces sp. NPDC007117]|uniref:HD domain-containing protein n=1 Tax=Streptomyces sp. NPDC007117 TaxID=3154314 RepID=UPI0033E079D2
MDDGNTVGEVHNLVSGGTQRAVMQGGTFHVYVGAEAPTAPLPTENIGDGWVRAAERSTVWNHVTDEQGAQKLRAHACSVIAKLACVRDAAQNTLTTDPWQDPGTAVRFIDRVEWLLGEPTDGKPLDLYPAEAALLVLVPFLYGANRAQTASGWARVEPYRIDPLPDADEDRRAFEAFAGGHGRLIKRAALRTDATHPIGWWLFHRWLLERGEHAEAGPVRELLHEIKDPELVHDLGEILEPGRVTALLHAVRRGPNVTNAEFLDRLSGEDQIRVPAVPARQRVRDRRIALLLALAYGTCLDMAALPNVVVEHVGIPHPVDLGQLRETVELATWGGQSAHPTLRADCHHEAVIEGLRQYVARANEVLNSVDRTARDRIPQPMPRFPTNLSADEVRPAEGAFDGWAGFRLDEGRVRELLMGVQLYKDRDLAVRELYQNALDACRYRRARTQYLDRIGGGASYAFTGRIDFEQGRDVEGRAYLECRDNGIGMGEAELRGVFSQAGARFAEQSDFKLEHAAWREVDQPVEMHPNSRFGIGVLSYFMLADEFTVTTCRMGLDGKPGSVLRASIHGPGHLFRIVTTTEQSVEPGTRVRLYLREEEKLACVDVLERLLGAAEFATSARNESRRSHWAAGVVKERKQPDGERFGLDAHGVRTAWEEAPPGVQLTWTEHGGALLVDGLVVQPAQHKGVVSSASSGLTGVVVNLSGSYAPAQLSADRAEVLDDIGPALHTLLVQAADAFVVADCPALPDFAWLCRVALGSTELADLVTNALIRAGRPIPYGSGVLDVSRCGVLPSDMKTLPARGHGTQRDAAPWNFSGEPPGHIHLWRLLAHEDERTLSKLTPFCPELGDPQTVLPAMPSDQLLLAHPPSLHGITHWSWATPLSSLGHFLPPNPSRDIPLDTALYRAAVLGIHDLRTEGILDVLKASGSDLRMLCDASGRPLRRSTDATVTELVRKAAETEKEPKEVAVLWRGLGIDVPSAVESLADFARHDPLLVHDPQNPVKWFSPGDTVPPGRIVQACLDLDITVSEACGHYEARGLHPDRVALPERPDRQLSLILRSGCEKGKGFWLSRAGLVPPVQLLYAARILNMPPAEALTKYRDLGFNPPSVFPEDATTDDLAFLDGDRWGDDALSLSPPDPLPYTLLLAPGAHQLGSTIERFRKYGFDVPFKAPHRLDDLDEQLLSTHGPCYWYDLFVGNTMPFAYLVVAARSLFRSPAELAERMATYGLKVSCPDMPAGLSVTTAHELLIESKYDETYMCVGDELSWQELLSRNTNLNASLEQITHWLAELGMPVPDIGEQLHHALARVPRPVADRTCA